MTLLSLVSLASFSSAHPSQAGASSKFPPPPLPPLKRGAHQSAVFHLSFSFLSRLQIISSLSLSLSVSLLSPAIFSINFRLAS